MEPKKLSRYIVAVGLGIVSISSVDGQIQNLFSSPLPVWLASGLAALGIFVTLFGCALFLWPEEIARHTYQCRPAKRNELQQVHDMAYAHFGSQVSSLPTMKKWHDKNPEIFCIIQKVSRGRFKESREIVGYYAILPINQAALDKITSGEARAAHLSHSDIEKPGAQCAALFIGAVVGVTIRAKGHLLSIVDAEITKHYSKLSTTILTRPVTADGLRIVNKFDFSPHSSTPNGGLDALYTYTPQSTV